MELKEGQEVKIFCDGQYIGTGKVEKKKMKLGNPIGMIIVILVYMLGVHSGVKIGKEMTILELSILGCVLFTVVFLFDFVLTFIVNLIIHGTRNR